MLFVMCEHVHTKHTAFMKQEGGARVIDEEQHLLTYDEA